MVMGSDSDSELVEDLVGAGVTVYDTDWLADGVFVGVGGGVIVNVTVGVGGGVIVSDTVCDPESLSEGVAVIERVMDDVCERVGGGVTVAVRVRE